MDKRLGKARELVLKYREYVHDKDLTAILESLSDDASMNLTGFPVMKGKAEIRQFYEDSFAAGTFEFHIDITSEKIVADVIFINGKMQRITILDDKPDKTDELDFFFILKKDAAGTLKIWQIRLA